MGLFALWRCAAHLAGEEVRSGEEGAEALHNHHSATTVDGRDLSLHNLVIRIHLRHAIPRLAEEDAPPREHLLTVLVLVESKGEERQGAVSALSYEAPPRIKKRSKRMSVWEERERLPRARRRQTRTPRQPRGNSPACRA